MCRAILPRHCLVTPSVALLSADMTNLCVACHVAPILKIADYTAALLLPCIARVHTPLDLASWSFLRSCRPRSSWPHGPGNKIRPVGGGQRTYGFTPDLVEPYIVNGDQNLRDGIVFKYVGHFDDSELDSYNIQKGFVHAKVPISTLIHRLSIPSVRKLARAHKVPVSSYLLKDDVSALFTDHSCVTCKALTSVFYAVNDRSVRSRLEHKSKYVPRLIQPVVDQGTSNACKVILQDDYDSTAAVKFPPPPLTQDLTRKIIKNFCRDTNIQSVEENGCAVCGLLHLSSSSRPLKSVKGLLGVLEVPGVTKVERKSATERIREMKGPVLDYSCKMVCEPCRSSLIRGSVPTNALANNMWIGNVPNELRDLRFVEQLLVARVQKSHCYARVSASGLNKMKAHVIAFDSPVQKIYDILPPPLEDLDEVLAILFTGPCQPKESDFQRTPLLVRRNVVKRALEWLKLNHADYSDVSISYDNIDRYPESNPPVSIIFREQLSDHTTINPSIFAPADVEEGSADGDCPFVVHGLTGEQLSTKSIEELKGIALQHWRSGGKALRVGQSQHPVNSFNNPGLYPQMFPWLFPYGLGGIGASSSRLSSKAHKHNLLMYHDKRFQTDPGFPFAAFSHEQMKASSTGGFLAVQKSNFREIADRLLSVNQQVLGDVAMRMAKGDTVKPQTEDERQCFQVVADLDAISGKVEGSATTKKYMRNEIWSLVANKGAPSWYITLSPADVKHPICLYYADSKIEFRPEIPRSNDDAFRLIARNPVAGARFFRLMVTAFIKNVLGVGADHPGLYGDTSAYYGTVEQQGRLTLHLHLLLWISGGLSPDEARQKIMDSESAFQKELVEYLESSHQGEFLTGSYDDVATRVAALSKDPSYVSPTQILPESPPEPCENLCDKCKLCESLKSWWGRFRATVDDLLFKSNIHTCSSTLNKDGTQKKNKEYKGCMDNMWGKCRGRFPRPLFAQTEVDPSTGALNMKKGESWLNTFTSALTYLFRCNTDVTSLRSGTAIKGVLLYVTKYVTKPTLKTFVAFDTVRSVFHKNTVIIGGSASRQEKARSLMTKVVNSLSAKSEMGSPMISMYLLNHPDRYTDHKFRNLHWSSFVREAREAWKSDPISNREDADCPDKIPIIKKGGRVVGLSGVYDYIYRSPDLEGMTLYEWASRCERVKCAKENKRSDNISDHGPTVLRFTEKHPLMDTHATLCHPPSYNCIPNLIGGTLPRRDQGDRDYYCATMLALFKPWRSGLDLKKQGESWDDSFIHEKFSNTSKNIIKNMNIRYECLDARDDFHAQLKKGDVVFPRGMDDDHLFADLDQQEHEGDAHDLTGSTLEDEQLETYDGCRLGKREEARRATIASMAKILDGIGWSNPVEGMLPDTLNLNPGPFCDKNLPGNQWKAVVAKERSLIMQERMKNVPDAPSTYGENKCPAIVDVVDRSYLEKRFKSAEWEKVIAKTALDFCLNAEQKRAFRIVANHAASPGSEQLRMYMGGMGGTGKTQVLKALIAYFAERNESYRLLVAAPTGTAASLLGGSTYHSLFGINDMTEISQIQLAQVKSRLTGVDYVFFDEVSMLSCRDLYRIAARLAQVMGRSEIPFGGINMVFAGDFAQLPPVIGHEHASLYSRTAGSNGTDLKDQESAIGKSVWHQITTVVILRKNMRQKEQSVDDASLRCALENMRYKSCTPADIIFLRSRISNGGAGRPNVCDKQFRNVSVITAFNMHKDAINSVGAARFASETGQQLTHFYSEDKPSTPLDTTDLKTNVRVTKTTKKIKSELSESMQRALWNQPPCSTNKNLAGKLSLCIGLPVIIKHNSATELCITNGQEGVVYGWQSASGTRGQRMLDTLFVKLTEPPQPVNIPGLPPDVVPLICSTVSVVCQLPSDESVSVSRTQVELLVNYAMTDYASQGKTRPNNVVDLNNCRSHQSYYTALSRSASASGTLILQGFDASKITGKASGALRQEFRELELLDEISRLRYAGKLPKGFHDADRRNTLITSFRKCKGEGYVPSMVHRAITWGRGDPFLESSQDDVPWKIVTKKTTKVTRDPSAKSPFVPAKGAAQSATKRKVSRSKHPLDEQPSKKKRKISLNVEPESSVTYVGVPFGPRWRNNSCAYDSVVAILHSVWNDNRCERSRDFSNQNGTFLGYLAAAFSEREHELEEARDGLIERLHNADPLLFPLGEYISVHAVIDQLFSSSEDVMKSTVACSAGHLSNRDTRWSDSGHVMIIEAAGECLQDSVDQQFQVYSASRCKTCDLPLSRSFAFVTAPFLLAFDISKITPYLDARLVVPMHQKAETWSYSLRGVIYYGDHHFTCRMVDNNARDIWFHDGLASGSLAIPEQEKLGALDLSVCNGKTATVAIYSRCSIIVVA